MTTRLHRLTPTEVESLTTTSRHRPESLTAGVLAAASTVAMLAAGIASLLR